MFLYKTEQNTGFFLPAPEWSRDRLIPGASPPLCEPQTHDCKSPSSLALQANPRLGAKKRPPNAIKRVSCSHSTCQAWAGNPVPPCWEGARPGCPSVGQRGMRPEQVDGVSLTRPHSWFPAKLASRAQASGLTLQRTPSLGFSQFTTQTDKKMG